MGEYAKRIRDGETIKIGTCNEMYYMRYDQIGHVEPLEGNVDPNTEASDLRFRFPFPQEDHIEVGNFDYGVPDLGTFNLDFVKDFDIDLRSHHLVSFEYRTGFRIMLPCPESVDEFGGNRFMKNGYSGGIRIVAQRPVDGKLKLIIQCKSCEEMWRLDTLKDCEPLIKALMTPFPGRGEPDPTRVEIANRIKRGYFR